MSVPLEAALAATTLIYGITAHELGHVLGALTTRMSVQHVQIGRGWKIAEIPVGSARVRIDLGYPEGWVRALPRGTRHLRRRLATYALAGPLLGFAFALALLTVPSAGVRIAVTVLLFLNLMAVIPARARRPHPSGVVGTDGYTVLRAITNDESLGVPFVLAEVLGRARTDEAGPDDVIRSFIDQADPSDPTAVMLRSILPDADSGDLAAALKVASRQPTRRACLTLVGAAENRLVWAALASGEVPSELAVEAMGLALTAQPDNTAVRDTFAWALAATGHPGAGLKESNITLEDDTLSPEHRASCLLVNAICRAGVGDVDAAAQRRMQALELDPTASLLSFADRAIGTATAKRDKGDYAALAEPDHSIWELPPSLQPEEIPDGNWGEWIRHRLLPGTVVLVAFVVAIALSIVVLTLVIDL